MLISMYYKIDIFHYISETEYAMQSVSACYSPFIFFDSRIKWLTISRLTFLLNLNLLFRIRISKYLNEYLEKVLVILKCYQICPVLLALTETSLKYNPFPGTGASAIYALLGNRLFGWHFLATETDAVCHEAARDNVRGNEMDGEVEVRRVKREEGKLAANIGEIFQ